MYSQIEDLQIELWLEIFTYLKLHHQFQAFFNLNKRFNEILFSYRTHICSKNNDEDSQNLFTYILPNFTYRKDVTSLRLENTKKINFIDKQNLLDFPCLKTLILHRLNITEDLLYIFQQNTRHLRYLHVSSLVSGNKQSLHKLLEIIISLTNLHLCRLRLGISMSPLPLKISSKSSIKHLRLIGINENCSTDRIITLVQYLPCLQVLYILGNQLNFISSSDETSICTAPISSFTLNLNQLNISSIELMNFILILTPHVQELKIICRTPLENLTYLNYKEWLMFIQSSSNLEKLTLRIDRGNEISEQIWNRTCKLLSKSIAEYRIVFRIEK